MIVHLNGKLVPVEEAKLSPFDRGFIFGDGVYEGLRSYAGRMASMERHIRRMRASLAETRIAWDPSRLEQMSLELIRANALDDAFVYWQISRGAPAAGHPVRSRLPAGPARPTVFGYCAPQPPMEKFRAAVPTVTAAIREDTRWSRGHLKSTSMLGNILAALEAGDEGAQDALLVRDGLVAEALAANVLLAIPDAGGRTRIATPSLDSVPILGGVTRSVLLDAVPEIEPRPVRVEEIFRASEIMLCGTTSLVTSVVRLDGRPVGDGKPGPVARRLLDALLDAYCRQLGLSAHRCGAECRTTPAVA